MKGVIQALADNAIDQIRRVVMSLGYSQLSPANGSTR